MSMGRKKMNKYDIQHLNNLTEIQRQVERVFEAAAKRQRAWGLK